MDQRRQKWLLAQLVDFLAAEQHQPVPAGSLWPAFRGLVNTRPAGPLPAQVAAWQDELLQGLLAAAGIVELEQTSASPKFPGVRLWQGDITRLKAAAIVNAANSRLTGCWAPNHLCVDNAIQTFAGVQLRAECAQIIREQGHLEPTGQAKITAGYNLPARFVLHTVGPIVQGQPTPAQEAQLASCYTSCLDLAAARGLSSVAFCAISTGVFGFPAARAAELAVATVTTWLKQNSLDLQVVFVAYDPQTYRLYEQQLFG